MTLMLMIMSDSTWLMVLFIALIQDFFVCIIKDS